LLRTLLLGPFLSKTFCFIVGLITSLRIECIKGLFLKEKVIELDKIKKTGDWGRSGNNNLRVLRDIVIVYR
jgi:hypothetical protein